MDNSSKVKTHEWILIKFLSKRYGLDLGAWISFSEHLDPGYIFSENSELIKNVIKDLLSRYPDEFKDRMTPEAFGTLQFDLMEVDQKWLDIIIKEIPLEKEDIEY